MYGQLRLVLVFKGFCAVASFIRQHSDSTRGRKGARSEAVRAIHQATRAPSPRSRRGCGRSPEDAPGPQRLEGSIWSRRYSRTTLLAFPRFYRNGCELRRRCVVLTESALVELIDQPVELGAV